MADLTKERIEDIEKKATKATQYREVNRIDNPGGEINYQMQIGVGDGSYFVGFRDINLNGKATTRWVANRFS